MKVVSRKDAIQLGLKTYFTGKKCRNGHREKRETSNCVCRGCHRNNVRNYKISIIKKITDVNIMNKKP